MRKKPNCDLLRKPIISILCFRLFFYDYDYDYDTTFEIRSSGKTVLSTTTVYDYVYDYDYRLV